MKRRSRSSRESQSPSGKTAPPNEEVTTDQSEAEELSKEEPPVASAPKEPVTLKKVIIRSVTATLLAALYLSLLYSGHFYCILAVALTQVNYCID